jgi:hypothetical protein
LPLQAYSKHHGNVSIRPSNRSFSGLEKRRVYSRHRSFVKEGSAKVLSVISFTSSPKWQGNIAGNINKKNKKRQGYFDVTLPGGCSYDSSDPF